MANTKKAKRPETLTIGWCDNGTTDGKFTEGLLYTTLTGLASGIPIVNAIRVSGNQIARQRQNLLDQWMDNTDTDWLLWVDSDVELTPAILTKLWDAANRYTKPLMSGVYMITKFNETSMMEPLPDVFNETGDSNVLEYVHPLPHNQVITADAAGFGLLLMHRDVIETMRKDQPRGSFFHEEFITEETFVGEDIVFFRKAKASGIPLHVHTGCIAKHMKRFSFDEQYYYAYWALVNMQKGE